MGNKYTVPFPLLLSDVGAFFPVFRLSFTPSQEQEDSHARKLNSHTPLCGTGRKASTMQGAAICLPLALLGLLLQLSHAFVAPSAAAGAVSVAARRPTSGLSPVAPAAPTVAGAGAGAAIVRTRARTCGSVKPLQGLFGLGAPEIAVIVVVSCRRS
jgi:hypothetical protein